MSGGSFFDRIDLLDEAVGHGDLEMRVEMDQVYARYQWFGISRFSGRPLVYHRGGKSHFLNMVENSDLYMQELAARAITEDGSDLLGAAKDIAEHESDKAEEDAPRLFENLSGSGHPTVLDEGAVVYDRPPRVGRLSDDQLRALRRSQR